MPSPNSPRFTFELGSLWVLDFSNNGCYPAGVKPHRPASITEIRRESISVLASALTHGDPRPFLQRFSNGRRCFIVQVEQQLAAFGWASQTSECIGELEREIHLGSDEAYIWDCSTLPAYRRQRLYSALISNIAERLCAEGVRRVWIGSSLRNRPSIRGFINAGFQPVLSLVYARLAGLGCMLTFGARSAPQEMVQTARSKLLARGERLRGPLVIVSRSTTSIPDCAQIEAQT